MAPDSVTTSRQITPRLLFKCLCIGGNALTAYGALTFPIISPDLSENLQLSQRQLSTIVLAGLIGQYPFAAVAGELVDRVGTWACSAFAALVFGIGYGVFAWMMGTQVTPETPLSPLAFRIMVASYFMLGLGAVFSYFSAMFTAAKEFPLHNGLATGITLALFGLSPLFLSLPSYLFPSSTGAVDARSYIIFIGSLATTMHFISIFGLRGSPPPLIIVDPPSTDATESSADEETPLLIKPQPVERPGHPQTWLTVVRDGNFWWIFAIAGLILGSSEMVIGNIGTVVTSLLTITQGSSRAVSNQVQLLSICNTLSRLFAGPLIDLLCPNPLLSGRSQARVSRFGFVAFAGTLLIICYGYMGFLANSNDHTWLLSTGVGAAYGIMWTVLPGIVRLVWGEANFGRNFGMIAYAPFLGTTAWTYIFALNVERERGDGGQEARATSSRSTTSQQPSYRRPYEPDLLQSAVYSRTTQANPSSGSYQQWKPSVAAARRRDSDIESFVPSLNIPTTSSPSPTPGSGSDNPPSSRSRTYLASAIPPSLRRPSHASSRQSFDRDSDSQSTISATPKLSNDSSERRAFKGLRQKEVPVVKTAERSARSREPEAVRDVPVEQSRVEVLRSSPEETESIKARDDTPTAASTALVLRKQDPEPEDPRADFTTALVPTTMRRENSSSLSSIETPSDGSASRNTQETVATSVSSSSSPLGVTKVRRPSRDASFDMLFGEDSSVPKPSQSTVTDPQAPRKDPPTERSYPKSPPPAPLMMPMTLPDRNSIVEMPVAVPTGEAASDQPLAITASSDQPLAIKAPSDQPLAIKAPKAKSSRKRAISKPKFLAITEGSGSGGEEKRPSMADHPNWPKYLRLPQSPMSTSERLSTPEIEPASLPKDDDEVVYQPPLPAKPTPPRLTAPRARRRSNSGARGKRKNSADDSFSATEPPPPSPISPRQRRQSSPVPIVAELPPPSVAPQTTSPSGSRKEASPPALRPTTPLSTRRISLKQEDISPSYFDLRSPSTDKLPLVESSAVTPGLPVSTLPDLLASIFPPEPPVPVLPVAVKEETKPVTEIPRTEQPAGSPKPKVEEKRELSPTSEAPKPPSQPEAPRTTSPTPSIAHRPYLADYSRHFRTRSNSSISQITTAATGQATPASEQAVPPPSLAVPVEPSKPTVPSRPSSPAKELKKKESKPAVSSRPSSPAKEVKKKESKPAVASRQKSENQPPAGQAPSRPLVPPIFPFGRKRGDSSASTKVTQGLLEPAARERRNSHLSAKSVDPPPVKPVEEVSPVEIKTPIYEIYKAKSTFAAAEAPKETPEPSQTEQQSITSLERHLPAEQSESDKTFTPRQPEVPLISQAVLAKVLIEADEADDASTIGHALDMFPNPPPVGQAIDTPTETVRQGRYPITVPDVMMSSRTDSRPTIRERHIRRPSLQVEQLPEIRSESPAELKKPSPAPVQAPVSVPPEPPAERPPVPVAAPTVQFHPPPPPAVHPVMGASPSKESIQLPQRVTERKVAPSKPPTTQPPPMSLRRPSLEKVPTVTPAPSTSLPSQPTAAPITTRDRSASASSKLPVPSASTANQKTEPPPLPSTNPTPPAPQPSGHAHSRSNGTTRDFEIGSPTALRPALPAEDPVRSIRSRTRTHEREASAPSTTSDSRAAAHAHASSRHGHTRNGASTSSSRAHAGTELPMRVPPLPSKVSEAASAAPVPPSRHAEPSPPEAPPKPPHPSRQAPSTSAAATSKDSHRRHRVGLDNPTASPAPPPLPKLPRDPSPVPPPLPKLPRDPSPVPPTRHRAESPVGSGSSQVTDIVPPGVPSKVPAPSRGKGLLRGLFSRGGESSRGESSSKSSSRRPPLPPPPASHQSSSSERVDVPPVPSRSTASRSKPPTTAPPTHHHRSTPSPVPSVTAPRHAESTSASRERSRPPMPPAATSASVPRKASAPKDSNKGILSSVSNMFARRQHYAVSAASLEAVLGASNNNPASPAPSNINLDVPETPDRAAAVLTWRAREAGNKKIRRPGVTFADLGSEPGSPTATRPRA